MWEVLILVIVSMLAYFCFLEQLLVGDMGTSAIALSLPFSYVLGLRSSMASSTMETIRLVICSNSVFICRDLRTCFLRPGNKHYNIEYPCKTKVIARYIILSHSFYTTFGYNATQIRTYSSSFSDSSCNIRGVWGRRVC
ncbi:hypothetical protein Hanom_Chr14g01313301 [Helianthus anomalus]